MIKKILIAACVVWCMESSTVRAQNPNVESFSTARRITAGSGSLSIDKPTGVVAGDVLILFTNCTAGFTTACSGFTQITAQNATVTRNTAFYKVAGGSEPSTYSITVSGATDQLQGGLIRVSGAIDPASNAIEFASTTSSANPSVSPSVTPSDAASLVIRSATTARTNGTLTVTPATEVLISSVNGELPHMAASAEDRDASASGTANFTQPNARECALITIALAPIPSDPPTITSSNTFSMQESTRAVGTVTADGTGPIAFAITGGADELLFDIDADTGVITAPGSFDFENPEDDDVDNDYVIEVTATGAESPADTQVITITVTDEGGNIVNPLRGGTVR